MTRKRQHNHESEYQANASSSDTNTHRLYRNREDRIIAGVCSGLADYLGFERKAVRIVTAIALFPFPAFVIVGYIGLAILLPSRPQNLNKSKEKESFWRDVSNQPKNLFGELRHRFHDLELRLQRMESYMTSKEYEIDRELRD